MTISGHKTRSVFDRYNIVAPKQLLDAMKQLEAYDGTSLKNDGTSIAPTKSRKGKKL